MNCPFTISLHSNVHYVAEEEPHGSWHGGMECSEERDNDEVDDYNDYFIIKGHDLGVLLEGVDASLSPADGIVPRIPNCTEYADA